MTLNYQSPTPRDRDEPRRYNGKRVVIGFFLAILLFGLLFWLGILLFIAPARL